MIKHPTNKLERLKAKRDHEVKKKPAGKIRRAKEKEYLDVLNEEATAYLQNYRETHQP